MVILNVSLTIVAILAAWVVIAKKDESQGWCISFTIIFFVSFIWLAANIYKIYNSEPQNSESQNTNYSQIK